ncbi:flagellar biosynthesis protein FlhB [Nitrospira sp. Kam-Ns4a]
MAEPAGQRTERATARRRKEARERGQVPISREVPTAAVLLAGLALLGLAGEHSAAQLVEVMRRWLGQAAGAGAGLEVSPDTVRALLTRAGLDGLALALPPLLLGLTAVGVGAFLVQTGFLWPTKGLAPDFSRLNPAAGFARLASWRAAVELAKAVLKVVVIVGVVSAAVRDDLPHLAALGTYDLADVLHLTAALLAKAALWIGLALAAIAAADYAYQRFEWERGLRMTKEEVKQEQRETEGDPLVRARVRRVQREMARKRMMAAVPKADVVITNPTHLAVALRYDAATMAAPMVVAKGAGELAERIKAVARRHGVMVVENRFVAQTLYRLVDLGREVPADLYRAVAEILALVYRARGQGPQVPNAR